LSRENTSGKLHFLLQLYKKYIFYFNSTSSGRDRLLKPIRPISQPQKNFSANGMAGILSLFPKCFASPDAKAFLMKQN